MKQLYAMMVDLNEKRCLLVGGGAVAERKMHSLLEANARVTVVSPTVTAEIQKHAFQKKIIWHQRPYISVDGEGALLVIAATDSREVNEQVYRDAQQKSQWVNVVDNPSLCNFTVPSVMRRGNLQISVSTNGSSPSLAKRITAELKERYGEDYAFYLSIMEGVRIIVKRDILDRKQRSEILNEISTPLWIESFQHNPLLALRRLQQKIDDRKGGSIIEESSCG